MLPGYDIFHLHQPPLPANVYAYFTTRQGGVSDPPYHSLNLGLHSGDDHDAVVENRIRLRVCLPSPPRWLKQVHGNRAILAETAKDDESEADAAYTYQPGVVCAALTADCLPVLFYHQDGGGVGVAHAGWRGLVAGVLENTVAAMRRQHDSPINAHIGPGIGARHFIIADDAYEQLRAAPEDDAAFQQRQDGKWHADLSALATRRLRAAGVAQISSADTCTYQDKKNFFSARRDGVTGRQAALIYFTTKK